MLLYTIITFLVLLFIPKHTLLWRWLIGTTKGIDCTLNCLILLGDYRETVSGRLGKAYMRGVYWVTPIYHLVNLLFYVVEGDMNHCLNSIDYNVGADSNNDKTIWSWK